MWKIILDEVSKTILVQMVQVVVAVLFLVILLFAGLFFSHLIKASVIKTLKTLRLEEFFSKILLAKLLERAGIKYSATEMIGMFFYWIGLFISLAVILNAAGLTIAADLVNKIILYIPNAIVALFILIIGMFGASLLKNIVRTLTANAGIGMADVLGKAAEIIVIIFVSVMALEQLKINIRILETAIGIILSSAGLAIAIAFGLGCKDLVGKIIVGIIEKISNPE